MKLRTKFALVLLLMTVVLSGAVYGGLELYQARLVDGAQNDVNETADLTAQQLDRAVEDRKDFVGFVASRPDAARFNESDRFLTEFVDNSRFFAAQLVAANGTVVDFHGDVTQELQEESIGSDVGGRPYVDAALAGEVFVSEPEYVNSTGQYLVVISAPVFEDRAVKGVLATAIYLDSQTIFGVLGPISREDQHVNVSAGGTALYSSGSGFERNITAHRTVGSTGWSVTVVRNRASLVTQLRELAIAQGLGVMLVMLSVVGFGLLEYRTTLAQTRRLLDGFAALESGNYEYELSLAAAEEWEQISAGFNALSTSLAAREAALRQREQRLQVLNRVLRHNLRNSAAVVLGYAEMIRNRTNDEEVRAAATSVAEAGTDLEALSSKARQLEFTVEEREGTVVLDVAPLVAEVLEEIRAQFPTIEVSSTLPDAAWVRADHSLRMAIVNLCENACEHNESSDPRLDVVVERDDDAVVIEVHDNGEGIPEHEWSVIAAGQETPLEHGSGLGLWVAAWAIERSDGSLDFEVDRSEGSTVRITLIRADPAERELASD